MSKEESNTSLIIPVLAALGALGVFGLMFVAMHYYELIGVDTGYFDDGSWNNLGIINSITGLFGLEIDLKSPHKVSTLYYSVCLGIAFMVSAGAIMIANREKDEKYEVTEAV